MHDNPIAARALGFYDRIIGRQQRYKACFSTPDGQYVLRDLLKECGVTRDSIVPGQPDATAYQLGMKRIGLLLCKRMYESPEAMMQRATEAEESQNE